MNSTANITNLSLFKQTRALAAAYNVELLYRIDQRTQVTFIVTGGTDAESMVAVQGLQLIYRGLEILHSLQENT